MDDLGVRRKGGQLAGHPVIETGADGDDQIASWSWPCWRSRRRASPACPGNWGHFPGKEPSPIRVVVTGIVSLRARVGQLLGGIAQDGPAPDVHDRPAGVQHHGHRLLHLAGMTRQWSACSCGSPPFPDRRTRSGRSAHPWEGRPAPGRDGRYGRCRRPSS